MRTLVSFPRSGMNPYSTMLYLLPRAAQWNIRETSVLSRFVEHLEEIGAGDVIHIQWNWPIFRAGTDPQEVEADLETFCAAVERARQRGSFLFWTVHNLVSHDSEFLSLERRFSDFMGEQADRIIQLNDRTEELVRRDYSVGEAAFVTIEHSTYRGVYPQRVTRDQAREALGISQDRAVVGFVGQIRPYKGIERLLEAVGSLKVQGRDITVLLAGRPQSGVEEGLDRIVEEQDIDCRRLYEFVPDEDLQTWFRASDLMVFPYAKVLNSGSAYLSATFGTPCVLPREPQFESLFQGEAWVHLFDEEDPESLESVIAAGLTEAPAAREAADTFARRHLPWHMSHGFLELLQSLPAGGAERRRG